MTCTANILPLFLLLSLLASCAGTTSNALYQTASASSPVVADTEQPELKEQSTGAAAPNPAPPAVARRLVYNATVQLRVTRTDSAQAQVRRLVAHEQGYLVQTSEERMQLRVPTERLTAVLAALPRVGKVESQTLSGQDVTDEYTDYQIRLENAQKARQRYLELLARAANVTEAVAVEKELQRLNTETDRLTGHLKRLQHLTDYATLSVTLRPKVQLGPLGYVSVGLYKAVRWLFVWGKAS
ncbi:DUF4349 domain-containing protein [Hymenobacter sp. BT186]|uniref:DUF4349 domain-containing protein n=1 Tax=Hymenobacter telluris TaxID=2816474 RepID=A0A939F0V8_9BACT|nr:DUF4349 domain-containing protein [Hymenobacter telluris]MBO0360080.1 DUF4349 domain-containing protein [Hymenobacter telluris]MBW3376107.1 DUF4349 domain-containing protein [Hymenobacter norwichensis]